MTVHRSMRLQTRASAAKDQTGWWKWSVWVEAEPTTLKKIMQVTYTLHPTFPDPVRVVQGAARKFRLDSGGWGEFMIHAVVEMRGGAKKKLSHWLRLSDEAPAKTPRPRKGSRRVAGPPSGLDEVEGAPRVLVLHALREALVADGIARHLEKASIRVDTSRDLNPKLPFKISLERALSGAAAAVVVIGKEMPSDLLGGIDIVLNAKVRVVPVVVGIAKMPPALRAVQAIALPDGVPGPKFATELGARLGLKL